MPQAIAAMSTKIFIRQLLQRYGYRNVLVGNTLIMSVFLMLFAMIGVGSPVWQIVLQAFCYGALTSMQYTSMNALTYADIRPSRTSAASSIASTAQQLSISFGVAVAGLATMFFVPQSARSSPMLMIHGLHLAFLALGVFTALSTVVFSRLRPEDGAYEPRHKDIHLA
jgi:MFS family permease